MIWCSTRSRVTWHMVISQILPYAVVLHVNCMSCDYTSLVQDHTLVIICSLYPLSVQWQMLLNKASDISHLSQDVFVPIVWVKMRLHTPQPLRAVGHMFCKTIITWKYFKLLTVAGLGSAPSVVNSVNSWSSLYSFCLLQYLRFGVQAKFVQ